MNQVLTVALRFVFVAAPSPLLAQRSPLVPAAVHDALVGEISGDISFEHLRGFGAESGDRG